MRLQVLGRFAVADGDGPIDVPIAGQRVLGVLAVEGGVADRHRLAGLIWPDRTNDRALANLRTAIWRLPDVLRTGVDRSGQRVRLTPVWSVDLDEAVDTAGRLRGGSVADASHRTRRLLETDLLPDWDLDCLVVPRERHRQLRLHALEDLAEIQLRVGRALDAVDTTMAAIAAEPLRESAQALLLAAHLAAGNRAEVRRAYQRFESILASELHVEPSPRLKAMVERAGATW